MNINNITEAIGKQVALMLEIKLNKYIFLANYDLFFSQKRVPIEPLLGWECVYVCHELRTEKEGIYVKQ